MSAAVTKKATKELYGVVSDGNYQFVVGVLSAVALYQSPRHAAELARYMRLPIEVALYAVRLVR